MKPEDRFVLQLVNRCKEHRRLCVAEQFEPECPLLALCTDKSPFVLSGHMVKGWFTSEIAFDKALSCYPVKGQGKVI
ncbi:hypothetical protein D3C78_1715260 [compost metagenome]